jgi:putative DNA primase/helicase
METSDMFPPKHHTNGAKRIIAEYDYRDADGKLIFQAVRRVPKDFRQRRPDGKGDWIWDVKGCAVIPYRLPELLAADATQPVAIVEGEKDADRLAALGIVATCNAGGAGKWRPAHAKFLKGRHVVVLPDNDGPGRKHAEQVCQTLEGLAASIRVVELPDLPDKGDVSDWLDRGGTADELRKMFAAVEPWAPTRPSVVAQKSATPQDAPRLTDMGNAERFALQHGDSVRYCYAWEKWLVWSGKRWRIDDSGEVVRLAKDTARAIYREAADCTDRADAKIVCQWAHASQSSLRLEAMLKLAKSERPIPASHDSFDNHPWLLNCENGTIDLQTGKVLPHDPADMLTKTTGVAYPTEPGDDAVIWTDFLWTVFDGDAELIAFVQRLFGSALVGQQIEHLLPILHGSGANGKSVFTGTIEAALGEYAMTAPAGLLMVKRNEGHPTELADLFGKRLVIISETKDGQRLDEGLVKSVTGGDTIRARRMREDFWQFTPSHTAVVVTNHKPRVQGTDNGIWRRLRLVPFEVTIPKAQQDKQLPEKLRSEMPAVLRWLVAGCLAWQREGLAEPGKVLAATDGYREESDVFGRWFAETMEVNPQGECKAGAVFDLFKRWCDAEGERELSPQAFRSRMNDRIAGKRSSNGTWYLGVTPRET